ncbi:Disease resistance protein [Acorus calamus]|uniref:Disease resistance protein n=1 Tax=Acorus calamus TaxID=4465 RepID=A0AAV9DU78_ACOCL|nr:Disease resistance protein [Acorus calamus]
MWPCIMDIAKGAGKMLWEPIKLHASYFICCERYVDDLNVHVKKLDPKKQAREKMANEIGKEPSSELLDWLKNVKKVNDDAKRMADKVGEHQHCFTWFSDLGSRHSLGKEAVEKKALVDQLQEQNVVCISVTADVEVIESLFNEDLRVYQSTDLALQKVMDALQNNGVRKIGLHGMGGVGKTTLAREIKRRALEQKMFKKAIMVTISQNPNLDTIREKMAEQLGFDAKQYSVSSEKLFSLIKQVGQVLIILDDMWKSLNLSDIGIPPDRSPDGCKIILTSRNLEVCKSMRSKEIIQLGVLSSEDSWKMFKYYSEVVESSIDSGNVCCVAREVADECKGLPLAIATVGRALIEKSLPEWENALVQLRASVPDNIFELKDVFMQLKFSYDHLSTEAQSCFLLCSLFPEDAEISVEQLTLYAMGEGFLGSVSTLQETKNSVLSLVNKLKASCLLLEEGEKGETVKMHDVVRDVAIYIGSNENHEGCLSKSYQNEPDWENVKDCKRLSVINNSICILPEKPPECLHIQTLLLESNSEFSELKTIPDKFFEGMTSLRVLDLCYTSISSLPASMSYLTNLQVLDLDSCSSLEDISALGSQNKLQVLSLRNTKVKAWSAVVGKFTGLKYLDLRGIGKLRIPPKVISNLCQLEELHVGGSFTKWEVGGEETGENAPLHEIQSLIKLKTLSIEVDKYWEGMLDRVFIKLERFDIVLGPIITNSWTYEKRASLRASIRVNLSNLGLPGWVSTLLHKTERLELVNSSCPQLDATGGDGLQCMKILELEKCNEMEFIIIDQNRSSIPCTVLPRLKNLQLKNMEKLTGICSSPLPNGSLEELKGLKVDDCSKLNIHQILLMSNDRLEYLYISRHDSMKEIISTCSASRALLPKLRTMFLIELPELMSIWKGDSVLPLGSLSNLTFLDVTKCNELRYALSLSLAQTLESLEELYVYDCKMMEGLIPYDVVVVEEASSAATTFRKSISPFSRIFCNLRHLDIQHCLGVFLFPLRLAQNLIHLERLSIAFCNRMEVIVRGEEGEAEKGEDIVSGEGILFPRLQEVELGELPNLTSFCSVVGAGEAFSPVQLLPSLLKVHVHDCPRLTKLPLGSQSSPNLEMVKGEKEWFEGLVWDDEKSKTRFIPLFEVYEVEKEEEDDGEDEEI